jgi:hypothetical protein
MGPTAYPSAPRLPPLSRSAIRLAVACALLLVAGLASAAGAQARTLGSAAAAGAVAARGPIGWQTYRRLDLLPFVRHGVATYQVSSADPTSHNDDGNTGKYSCLHRVPQGCLMAEHHGPGELESIWTALALEPIGKLIIELDGHTVIDRTWPQLTAPEHRGPFAFPLALADYQSWGGNSLQVPMTFRREMRVISQYNPHYYHVVYRTFQTADDVQSAGPETKNPPDILAELRQAGTRDPKPKMGPATQQTHFFSLPPGQSQVVARINGTGAISALRLRFLRYGGAGSENVSDAAADVYHSARLRMTFDGVRTVDAPVGEFFGSGLGPAPVRALMFGMQGTPTGWATTWWPMPFAASATIQLVNDSHTTISSGETQVTWARNNDWGSRLGSTGSFGYFHAYGHRGETTPGKYWTFLSTRGAGTFMGVTMTMEGGSPSNYLEGNERAYVDGSAQPQIQGTGTEDFFDGGWYFFDQLFTLPLSGYTAHETADDGCPRPTCKTTYRLMIADAVPFDSSILYEIQHGPENNVQARYSSTAYWYQRPSAR